MSVRRVVLTPLAGVLWLAGWLAGVVAVAVVWVFLALKVGWRDAHKRG